MRWKLAAAAVAVLMAGCSGYSGSPSKTPTSAPTVSEDFPPPCCGNGFAPQTGHVEATSPAAPGIRIVADLRTCNEGFCVTANATNTGSRTYYISSICAPPWMDSMKHEGDDVQPHEPQYQCQAFGTKPFAPGDWAEATFAWDQMLWDSGHAEPAPEGGYDWSFHFDAMDDSDGGGRHIITATLHVRVGET